MNVTVSPTRTYVALCLKEDGSYCFKSLTLSELSSPNNSRTAEWYFQALLDRIVKRGSIYLLGCMSIENYQDIDNLGTVKETTNDQETVE